MEAQAYYVALRLKVWADLEIRYGPRALGDVRSPDGSLGYMPVYETLEALEAQHGAGTPWALVRRASQGQDAPTP